MNMHAAPNPTFEPRELRNVFGCFATGVTVVTTCGEDGQPIGLAVNSFASVSLEPAEILWSIVSTAPSRSAFERHGAFAVNVVAAEDKEQTLRFATPIEDKFDGVDWHRGWRDVPVLGNAIATLQCDVKDMIQSGDHHIMVGSVRQISSREGDPLLFYRGKFAALGEAV